MMMIWLNVRASISEANVDHGYIYCVNKCISMAAEPELLLKPNGIRYSKTKTPIK